MLESGFVVIVEKFQNTSKCKHFYFIDKNYWFFLLHVWLMQCIHLYFWHYTYEKHSVSYINQIDHHTTYHNAVDLVYQIDFLSKTYSLMIVTFFSVDHFWGGICFWCMTVTLHVYSKLDWFDMNVLLKKCTESWTVSFVLSIFVYIPKCEVEINKLWRT